MRNLPQRLREWSSLSSSFFPRNRAASTGLAVGWQQYDPEHKNTGGRDLVVFSAIGFGGDHSLLCLSYSVLWNSVHRKTVHFCSVHSLFSSIVLYRFPLLQISGFLTNFDFKTLFLQHVFQCFFFCIVLTSFPYFSISVLHFPSSGPFTSIFKHTF